MTAKYVRCGTEYVGWTCPTCLHREELEKAARAQLKAQQAQRGALPAARLTRSAGTGTMEDAPLHNQGYPLLQDRPSWW